MNLNQEWYTNEFDKRDTLPKHRPIQEEYSFYQAVKTGNLDYVRNNCENGTFCNPNGMGILSADPLTNIKYHFVITVAMITRHCVEGGMASEHAYRLSDFYIQKMDKCKSITEVTNLHKYMVIDYTSKMLLLKKEAVLSKPVSLCMDYIYNHIHERITINDLAEYTHLSPSYLSKLFKKEQGISVSDYIRERKIDTAQDLLHYSNYSLVEIANSLAFSSQSHFIQIFEKYTGTTPKKYRDAHFKTSW